MIDGWKDAPDELDPRQWTDDEYAWIPSPECPSCRCHYLVEMLDEGHPQRISYYEWRDAVHARDFRCPHLVFWDLGCGWDWEICVGPLSDSEDWFWSRDPDVARLREVLDEFTTLCGTHELEQEALLWEILGARPAWAKEGSGDVDLSPAWLPRVPELGIVMDLAGGQVGMPGTCFPSIGYYAEDPEQTRKALALYLSRHAIKIERYLAVVRHREGLVNRHLARTILEQLAAATNRRVERIALLGELEEPAPVLPEHSETDLETCWIATLVPNEDWRSEPRDVVLVDRDGFGVQYDAAWDREDATE